MLLGYNTNGLAHHRLVDAVHLLADAGYRSVALTLDAGALDPYDDPSTLIREIGEVRAALDDRNLARVVETGARYLLNPRKKHDPTLMDRDPARRGLRVDFLRRSLDIAVALDARVVSIWSGAADPGEDEGSLFDRLVAELQPLLDEAHTRGRVVGFEPEPGMFIDTMARFARLEEQISHPAFQLTLDIGHVHCLESEPIPAYIHRWAGRIVNVHIEDMIRGVHEHLRFGQGTIDFPPVLRALSEAGYAGGLHVELSRQSADGVNAVLESRDFLSKIADALLGD